MLRRSNQLEEIQVASLHTGGVIDVTRQVIIDPNKLEVIGFYLQEEEGKILLARDIREINNQQAVVDSSDVLADKEDLLRLKETLEIDYRLIGARAKTKSGQRLGSVGEYVIDDISWLIQKVHIKQSLIRSFATGKLIIDRRQIVEVTDKTIVVDDAVLRTRALAPQQAP